jgi:hypothetical protein
VAVPISRTVRDHTIHGASAGRTQDRVSVGCFSEGGGSMPFPMFGRLERVHCPPYCGLRCRCSRPAARRPTGIMDCVGIDRTDIVVVDSRNSHRCDSRGPYHLPWPPGPRCNTLINLSVVAQRSHVNCLSNNLPEFLRSVSARDWSLANWNAFGQPGGSVGIRMLGFGVQLPPTGGNVRCTFPRTGPKDGPRHPLQRQGKARRNRADENWKQMNS